MSVQLPDDSKKADLPTPKPPLDPAAEPFVGNETVDDNLAETARVVLWNIAKGAQHSIGLSVVDRVATLSGVVDTRPRRRAIEAAIAGIAGIRAVVDDIGITSSLPVRSRRSTTKGVLGVHVIEPRRFIYLIRYCGLTEASLSAAIREAAAKLDAFFVSRGLTLADTLFVLYRNVHSDMVTIEIGMPVGADVTAEGEFHLGSTPGGPMVMTAVAAGIESLTNELAKLASRARAAGLKPADYFWQHFANSEFRVWDGHPKATVFLPLAPSAR